MKEVKEEPLFEAKDKGLGAKPKEYCFNHDCANGHVGLEVNI